MDSKENTHDISLDNSHDVSINLNQTNDKIKHLTDNIDEDSKLGDRIFEPLNAREPTYISDEEDHKDDFDNKPPDYVIDDETKYAATKSLRNPLPNEIKSRYGPATKKWKDIIVKHKIVDPEHLLGTPTKYNSGKTYSIIKKIIAYKLQLTNTDTFRLPEYSDLEEMEIKHSLKKGRKHLTTSIFIYNIDL